MNGIRNLFRRSGGVQDKMRRYGAAQQGTVLSVHTYQSGLRDVLLAGLNGNFYAALPRGHRDVAVGDVLSFQVNGLGEGRLVA